MARPLMWPHVLMTLILALAACRGEKPVEGAARPAFKHAENTVYLRLPAEPDGLNPLLTNSLPSRIICDQLFQVLLQFDPQTLELSPQLAEGPPEIREIPSGPYRGGMAYTYTLRKEARWDNGQAVTNKDVVFSFKAMFHPQIPAPHVRSFYLFVRDVEADPADPRRFTVLTDRRYILAEPAIGNMVIYPEYLFDPQGVLRQVRLTEWVDPDRAGQQISNNPALSTFAGAFNSARYSREPGFVGGSGPYRLVEWTSGQQLILEKKKDWWGDGLSASNRLLLARPDRIQCRIVPDQNTALTAMRDEELDVNAQIDARDFVSLQQDSVFRQYFNLHTPNTFQLYYLGLNNQSARLSDKRVRRALAHTLDVDLVIRTLFYGLAERCVGPFHPSRPYYHRDLPPLDLNIEKAIALLKEAGWEDTDGNGIADRMINGERVEMELEYLTTAQSKFGANLVLLMQEGARQAGIGIRVKTVDFNVLRERLNRRDFELFAGAWSMEALPDDPRQLWHTESIGPGGSNRVGFGNAQTDALIEQIQVTIDPEARWELYRRFQEVVYEEQPCIFLFTPQERIAIHKRFEARPGMQRPGFFVNEFKLIQ